MNTISTTNPRPALDTLACVNERCTLYGQAGQDYLTVRGTYGKDGVRYLHCRCCGAGFSERKNTALWNIKVAAEKAAVLAGHLAEGCSRKATARLAKVLPIQIVKHREGQRVVAVDIRYAHGSQRRVQQVLGQLGYFTLNSSAIERRNGTARRMSAYQVRRSMAFAPRADTHQDRDTDLAF